MPFNIFKLARAYFGGVLFMAEYNAEATKQLEKAIVSGYGRADVEAVKSALANGADPNGFCSHPAYSGDPFIVLATERHDYDAMERLLQAGANPNITARGHSALEAAFYSYDESSFYYDLVHQNKLKDPVALLLGHGAKVTDGLIAKLKQYVETSADNLAIAERRSTDFCGTPFINEQSRLNSLRYLIARLESWLKYQKEAPAEDARQRARMVEQHGGGKADSGKPTPPTNRPTLQTLRLAMLPR